MNRIKKVLLFLLRVVFALVVAFDLWGALTLGTIELDPTAPRDKNANSVVMVFGATGSVGDGLLKAALADPEVEKVYVVTRSTSQRIDAALTTGKLEMRLLEDFTDYAPLADILGDVNTVLWGLGASSRGMDDDTYTWIHVDFPVAFVKAWLTARQQGPMSFHSVTGMGTDPEGRAHWAREKGRAELEVAQLAQGTGLRTFGYRSAFVRPTSEQSNALHYVLEALLQPGYLVIPSIDLGNAMLEISARTSELQNGSLLDNKDTILYAVAYRERLQTQRLLD
jgi:hypothetical protein